MIKKCLFPAPGYGTRFLSVTKSMSKEMMPVVNKSLIEYGVEESVLYDRYVHSDWPW
ncbi:sugar phosphate nucleotidyltransferase [Moritella viscosa]|uniref:sugar phosphate nucleotidyltransferase n=1 Tax=Moritella viscosa TaxID=80854 RepID=UPI0009157B88|nr:UTP--glucose-1-phosphate uridylyltransferase [Moritella viscosa]